jgi:hypothetical protein
MFGLVVCADADGVKTATGEKCAVSANKSTLAFFRIDIAGPPSLLVASANEAGSELLPAWVRNNHDLGQKRPISRKMNDRF